MPNAIILVTTYLPILHLSITEVGKQTRKLKIKHRLGNTSPFQKTLFNLVLVKTVTKISTAFFNVILK